MSLRITNIQRFSLHDGPGIRTTIFLKGCAAKCPWCANPENIDFFTTFSFDEKKCIKDKGHCFLNKECPILRGNKSEAFNNDCISKCKAGALSIVGENISAKYLLSEILKDKEYYGTNGGVTFSGGEVLLQTDSLIEILQELKEKHINVAIESSLFAPFENVKKIIPYVDYYIVDVKILDPYDSKEKLGIEIDIYLKNLKYLYVMI